MNKTLIAGVATIILIGVGYIYLNASKPVVQTPKMADYKNIAYTIEGQRVQLVDGKADVPMAPDSASRMVTTYFGNDATGDLNGDTIPDVAFLVVQNGGGSGSFYYVVAALQQIDGSYIGIDALALGDRIAPQSTSIKNQTVTVNYADRKPDEPMSAQPSVGVSKFFQVQGTRLTEVTPAQGKLPATLSSMGTYTYECDEHVKFTMSPADEMTSITIAPLGSATFPPKATLLPIETPKDKGGHWFTDGLITFTGQGEGVTITSKGSAPLNCSPVPDAQNAPWNWGD